MNDIVKSIDEFDDLYETLSLLGETPEKNIVQNQLNQVKSSIAQCLDQENIGQAKQIIDRALASKMVKFPDAKNELEALSEQVTSKSNHLQASGKATKKSQPLKSILSALGRGLLLALFVLLVVGLIWLAAWIGDVQDVTGTSKSVESVEITTEQTQELANVIVAGIPTPPLPITVTLDEESISGIVSNIVAELPTSALQDAPPVSEEPVPEEPTMEPEISDPIEIQVEVIPSEQKPLAFAYELTWGIDTRLAYLETDYPEEISLMFGELSAGHYFQIDGDNYIRPRDEIAIADLWSYLQIPDEEVFDEVTLHIVANDKVYGELQIFLYKSVSAITKKDNAYSFKEVQNNVCGSNSPSDIGKEEIEVEIIGGITTKSVSNNVTTERDGFLVMYIDETNNTKYLLCQAREAFDFDSIPVEQILSLNFDEGIYPFPILPLPPSP